MENLAEIILENGITEPNFRYTGARHNMVSELDKLIGKLEF